MGREYNSLASLLNTLAFVHAETDLEQFRAQKRKGIIVAVILTLLIFFSTMTKTLLNVSSHIQVHDWWGLTGDLLFSLPILLIFLAFSIALMKSIQGSSSLPEKVLELRTRLNDEALVPPVAEQPLPFESGELPFIPARIGPVRRIKNLSIFFIGTSIFLLLIDILLGTIIAALLPWIQVPGSATSNLWAALALSILLLFCAIFTVLGLVLAIRLIRANTVVVDEWGLRWKWPNLIKGRSIALAWPEITGFYEITNQESKDNPVKTYVLDSTTSTFIWDLREDSTQKERHASAYLTRLIATRTGLSLRNLTGIVEPLLNPSSEAKEMEVLVSSLK